MNDTCFLSLYKLISSILSRPLQGDFSSQTYLHIDVDDVNDNAPVFRPEKYKANLSRDTQPGAEILTVFATDRDSDDYGRVSYELLPGDHASFFSVNESSGETDEMEHLC